MRLKRYINELAMKADTNNDHYSSTIELSNGRKFYFDVYANDLREYYDYNDELPEDLLEIIFFNPEGDGQLWEVIFTDEKGRTSQTKAPLKETPLQLFAAIETVMKDFLKKVNPQSFSFSSNNREKSRMKLYDLLQRRLGKKYNNRTLNQSGEKLYFFWK